MFLSPDWFAHPIVVRRAAPATDAAGGQVDDLSGDVALSADGLIQQPSAVDAARYRERGVTHTCLVNTSAAGVRAGDVTTLSATDDWPGGATFQVIDARPEGGQDRIWTLFLKLGE